MTTVDILEVIEELKKLWQEARDRYRELRPKLTLPRIRFLRHRQK